MKFYSQSPITSEEGLMNAIEYVHFACFELYKKAFKDYLPIAGNIGIFCHYPNEYEFLTRLRENMTEASDNFNQKYFRLHKPITIPSKDGVPEATYTYLYIRKPDPYRHHAGDVDFVLDPIKYAELKQSLERDKSIPGVRTYQSVNKNGLDMIEIYDPDIDALAYIVTETMADILKVTKSTQPDNS